MKKHSMNLFIAVMSVGLTMGLGCSHKSPTPLQPEYRQPQGTSGPITSWDMAHTVQNCKHAGHQPTWCEGLTDMKPMVEASGLEAKIIAQLDRALQNPSKSRVFAAEFSFSSKGIQSKMCDLGKAGVPVKVYLDRGSMGQGDFANDPKCQKNPLAPTLTVSYLGGFTDFPEWRLHHNKTVLIDAGDGSPYNIDYSSGNLSAFGMSLHMDHWVMLTAQPTANLSKATLCLFESLDAAMNKANSVGMYKNGSDWSKDPVVMKTYQDSRNKCYSKNKVIAMNRWEDAINAEGIAPFFTPNQGDNAKNALIAQFRDVIQQQKFGQSYIYIAIEHFSMTYLAQILNQAADAGVDVRIILNSGTVSGSSEVASDEPFYRQNLKPGRIKVRFIETNPAAGGNGQQMHNKFAILNGKRVFSGAGHYTNSGLATNFETLYLAQNSELTADYAKYFKELWDVSVDEDSLVNGTPTKSSAPSALDPRFLQIAQ